MKRCKLSFWAARGLLLAGALLLAGQAVAKPRDIGREFNCRLCHVDRISEVKRPQGPLLVDPAAIGREAYGAQDPASTERMCLSCHDGFVADSRFVWSDGHPDHPVGAALPKGMAVAEVGGNPVAPLNEEGEVYCGSCHSAHPPRGAPDDAPVFLRVHPESGDICSNCHADKTAVVGTPHARARNPQPPDFEKRGACGGCHAPHDNQGALMWAKSPGADKVAVDGLCASCHRGEPGPAGHPPGVLAWSQSVREALTGKPALEMPVFDVAGRRAERGAISCATCHNPHRLQPDGWPAEVPAKFLRVADTEGFLCADCHASSALFLYKFYHSQKSRR